MKNDEPAGRDRRGKWLPGRSANPAGRPPNVGSSARLRASITAAMPGIIERLIEQALAGDTGAARALLALSVPPLKAAEEPTPVELAGATLTEQGRSVLAAVSAGALAPSQGQALLAALADLARLRAEDDHEARLAAIESAQAERQGLRG